MSQLVPALLAGERAERLSLPDRKGPPSEIPSREPVALRRHQDVATDVEVLPRWASQVTTAGHHAQQFESRMRHPSPSGFPVVDGAHADAQQLGAGLVGQGQLPAVGAEPLGAVHAVQKLPVAVTGHLIRYFA